jgi:hypothetical protein
MKNLKLTLLLFALCALITTQFTFAQDNERIAEEQAKLKEQMARGTNENAALMLQELKTLHEQYESASDNDRVAIKEKINALKASYNQEVKGDEGNEYANDAVKDLGQEYNIDDKSKNVQNSEEYLATDITESLGFNISEKEAFIKDAKLRLAMAKEKLASDIENGKVSEMDIKIKKNKIAQVEEKLMNYVVSVDEAKRKLSKRN